MDNLNDPSPGTSEYQRLFSAYRSAHATMLRLAEDPSATAEDFREASELVAQLSDRLARFRALLPKGYPDRRPWPDQTPPPNAA